MGKSAKGVSDSRSTEGSVPRKPGTSTKKPSVSKSAKAGLVFPVARVNRRLMENKTTKRVGAGAPIFMTAVIELFAAEILDVAITEMTSGTEKRLRLAPTDVLRAIRNDRSLNKALNGLRVMVGDKQKDTAEMIMSKTDMDTKQLAKMQNSDSFDVDGDVDVSTNWKRYKKEMEAARA